MKLDIEVYIIVRQLINDFGGLWSRRSLTLCPRNFNERGSDYLIKEAERENVIKNYSLAVECGSGVLAERFWLEIVNLISNQSRAAIKIPK